MYALSLLFNFFCWNFVREADVSGVLEEFQTNLEFWYFRLGYVFEQKMLDEEPNIRWMASMPKWCFPKKLITLGLLMKHNDTLRYGNEYALQDLENCTKYYHGQSLTGKIFYWF